MLVFKNCSIYVIRGGKSKIKIISDFSYSFEMGKFYLVFGKSGAGKSTLFRSLVIKNLYIIEGYYKLEGKLVIIPQDFYFVFNPFAKIKEHPGIPEIEKSKYYLDSYPWQLSGGEMLKILIKLIKSKEFDVLVFDETTENLDDESKSDLLLEMINLKEKGKCVIFITHDILIISKLIDKFDDTLIIDRGRIEGNGENGREYINQIVRRFIDYY